MWWGPKDTNKLFQTEHRQIVDIVPILSKRPFTKQLSGIQIKVLFRVAFCDSIFCFCVKMLCYCVFWSSHAERIKYSVHVTCALSTCSMCLGLKSTLLNPNYFFEYFLKIIHSTLGIVQWSEKNTAIRTQQWNILTLVCIVACPMGSFSPTGLQPCNLCKRRSFQPNKGRRQCLPCPGTTLTKAEGSKNRLDCIGMWKI